VPIVANTISGLGMLLLVYGLVVLAPVTVLAAQPWS
jgi:hypothetical protein